MWLRPLLLYRAYASAERPAPAVSQDGISAFCGDSSSIPIAFSQLARTQRGCATRLVATKHRRKVFRRVVSAACRKSAAACESCGCLTALSVSAGTVQTPGGTCVGISVVTLACDIASFSEETVSDLVSYSSSMETIICGISALLYWRIPPIIQLLACGPEDDALLGGCVTHEEILVLRTTLLNELPLARVFASQGSAWRNAGPDAKNLREVCSLLALGMTNPVEILVRARSKMHSSTLVKPRLFSSDIPFGTLQHVSEDVFVVSPELALAQVASWLSPTRCLMLLSELCGQFALYRAPASVARVLERMHRRGLAASAGGWQPCFTAAGALSDLWMRPPLLTPSDVTRFVGRAGRLRGKRRLAEAASLVVPDAASPFETQAGILLGLDRSRGGEGYGGLMHNHRVDLSEPARRLAGRSCCYCDLYWEDGLDVECQSAMYHDNERSWLSDAERSAALSLMGIGVLPMTSAQLFSQHRFESFSRAVATVLDRPLRPRRDSEREAQRLLRAEVLGDWLNIPPA